MEKMGSAESELEDLFERKKRVKNPLVPIDGALSSYNDERTDVERLLTDLISGPSQKSGKRQIGLEMASNGSYSLSCDNSVSTFKSSGALITAGVLTAGLISFKQGNSVLGQKLMRARLVTQGATAALMIGSAYFTGIKSSVPL